MNPFAYLFALVPAMVVAFSWTQDGWMAWFSVLFIFGLVPAMELMLGVKHKNYNEETVKKRSSNPSFDVVLYLIVPVQLGMILYFGDFMSFQDFDNPDTWAHIAGMGILCGSYGINVAHELGHRQNKWEQFMAKTLLMTSLYMHFFIEHNRGHHKHVATPEDPSTARRNESVYAFWFRSMFQTYLKAWKLESERLKRHGTKSFHWKNEMIQFSLAQLGYLGVMWFLFGLNGLLGLVFAGVIGALLLETINYIEHYGLLRKKMSNGTYERVEIKHSWNSDHVVGRLLLFELSRHSDHHYKTNKKYQTLISATGAPQMPTGYPGMMVLSMVSPLWFFIMNRRLEAVQTIME